MFNGVSIDTFAFMLSLVRRNFYIGNIKVVATNNRSRQNESDIDSYFVNACCTAISMMLCLVRIKYDAFTIHIEGDIYAYLG